jgi:hypothetical protein
VTESPPLAQSPQHTGQSWTHKHGILISPSGYCLPTGPFRLLNARSAAVHVICRCLSRALRSLKKELDVASRPNITVTTLKPAGERPWSSPARNIYCACTYLDWCVWNHFSMLARSDACRGRNVCLTDAARMRATSFWQVYKEQSSRRRVSVVQSSVIHQLNSGDFRSESLAETLSKDRAICPQNQSNTSI